MEQPLSSPTEFDVKIEASRNKLSEFALCQVSFTASLLVRFEPPFVSIPPVIKLQDLHGTRNKTHSAFGG
jgi:hypothetical protein